MRVRAVLIVVCVAVCVLVSVLIYDSHRTKTPKLAETKTPQPKIIQTSASQATEPAHSVGLRLEGQAVGEAQEPIAGALVHLLHRGDILRTATAEADGSFAFDGLDAGQYSATAVKDDLSGEPVLVTLSATSEPVIVHMRVGVSLEILVLDAANGGPIDRATIQERLGRTAITNAEGKATLRGIGPVAAAIVVAAPNHAAVTDSFLIGSTSQRTVRLPRGAQLGGRVVAPDGSSVSGATVRVANAANGANDDYTTDRVGTFNIGPLAASRYLVTADAEGYAPTSPLRLDLDGIHDQLAIVVHVTNGTKVTGTVVDSDGHPSAGAVVQLRSVLLNWHREIATDEDGSFKIVAGNGAFRIWARKGLQSSPQLPVDLGPNTLATLKLQLQNSTIAGTVIDANGEPVAEAKVTADDGLGQSVRGEVTDSHGKFVFNGLAAGNYTLAAHRQDELSESDSGKGTSVTSGDRNVRLVVPALTAIKGRVLLDKKPVVSFAIIVVDQGDEMQWRQSATNVTLSSEGRFVKRGVSPGTKTVVIFGRGFARTLINARVVNGKVTDLGDIAVDHGQEITGRVTDASGAPVGNATVEVKQATFVRVEDPEPLMRSLQGGGLATTDESGWFRIEDIPPPTGGVPNQIGAKHPNRGVAPLRNLPSSVSSIDLALVSTGSIEGLFTGADSDLYQVWANPTNGSGETASARVAADRTFKFERLAAGEYNLTPANQNADGYRLAPTPVYVSGGKVASVTIKIQPSASVRAHTNAPCQIVLLAKPGTGDPGPDDMLGYGVCAGEYATIKDVPIGDYRVCNHATCISVSVHSAGILNVELGVQ